MERVRPLLAVSMSGLVAVVLWGCGKQDASGYRTYTPEPEAAAEADSPAEAALPTELAQSGQPDDASPDASAGNPAPEPADDAATVENDPAGATTDNAVAAESPAASAAENTPDAELLATIGATDLTPVPIEPRETKLLIPEKSFTKESGALRVSYDDIDLLKVLNMEPVTAEAPEHFPEWLKSLDGKRIRLRGYMRPGELSEGLPFFVLARDTMACCFGPNTKAYDIIPVIMREGVTTDYIHMTPFDIAGVFHINVEMDLDDPNKVEFLYFIDDAVLLDK